MRLATVVLPWVLVPALAGCVVQQHAEVDTPHAPCFEACDDKLDCVARCPGASTDDGPCPDDHEFCTTERSLTTSSKIAIIIGAIALPFLGYGALVLACSGGGGACSR